MSIQCSHHIASSFIVLDILLVMTYLYGLFIFRFKQPEDLSGLIQKVCTVCFFPAISAGILPGILHDRGKAIKKAIRIHVVRNTRPNFFLQDIAEML